MNELSVDYIYLYLYLHKVTNNMSPRTTVHAPFGFYPLSLTSQPALRTGLDSANPYNPVPEKGMAEEGNFLSESTSSAVGSRRSRAAAFGDNTLDDIVASPGRRRGRAALEAEGVLTSSSATTVRDTGELIRTNPVRICLKR